MRFSKSAGVALVSVLAGMSVARFAGVRTSLHVQYFGKVVATGRRVISKDGKVMTITTKGTDTDYSVVQVYDKR